jgi:23S rRNA (cytosine1962-C5)-methyltransferase
MARVILKKNREDALIRRHPWIFSGAIERVEGELPPGATVIICDAAGQALALGAYSPTSQIRVRIWSFDPHSDIDKAFFKSRLQVAIEARNDLMSSTNAQRLVFSEADALPGLIVDRYGDVLVCQFLSAGADFHKSLIVECLQELLACNSIYERSDVSARAKEGLSESSGLLSGEQPSEIVLIRENGLSYQVNIREGHKTGFYLDQRDNRAMLAAHSEGREVLNCFSYTGGFGLAAMAGGAKRVINIDSSEQSLQMASSNAALNKIDSERFSVMAGDVFSLLREMNTAQQDFDLIVLDPPKFIDNKQQIDRGARAYKDINLQAFKLLRPGGLLFTFSCSGLMPDRLFQKIVADAALDAQCQGQIIHQLKQAGDHPVSLNFPEAAYLKGFCIRKVNTAHGY